MLAPQHSVDETVRAWLAAYDTPDACVAHLLVAYLRECDPLTGEVVLASKTNTVRYQGDRPGELVHVDVKKIGKFPRRLRMESPRSADGVDLGQETGPDRLRQRALDGRRPLPAGLRRNPPRREGHDLCRAHPAGLRLLRCPRHHPDRAGHHFAPS